MATYPYMVFNEYLYQFGFRGTNPQSFGLRPNRGHKHRAPTVSCGMANFCGGAKAEPGEEPRSVPRPRVTPFSSPSRPNMKPITSVASQPATCLTVGEGAGGWVFKCSAICINYWSIRMSKLGDNLKKEKVHPWTFEDIFYIKKRTGWPVLSIQSIPHPA
jgi:hypothetical protein